MLIELLIDLIHPFPYYDKSFHFVLLGMSITYNIMTLLYALIFLKIYKIIRILASYTSYTNFLSEKHCSKFGTEVDTSFALKCLQKDSPFKILTISFIVISVILGIVLRMFEILNVNGNGYSFFRYYTNGIWCIIIIMTTVGYGDYYPTTHLGRIVAVITIVVGTLLVSLTIVALNAVIEFKPNENQAFTILKRSSIDKKLKSVCQKIIANNYKLFKLKRSLNYENKVILARTDYMKIVRKLKNLSSLKYSLELELHNDVYLKTDDKFIVLNDKIEDELFYVKESLSLIIDYKHKLNLQVKQQKQLLNNIENNLKIVRNHLSPHFYKLALKNPNLQLVEKESNVSNDMLNSIEFKTEVLKQIDNILFLKNIPTKNYFSINDSTFMKSSESFHTKTDILKLFRNQLKNKIVKKLKIMKNDFTQIYDSEKIVKVDKDPIKIEYEKFQNLDLKTRQIISKTSKKTIDLLSSLNDIANRNATIFSKGKTHQELQAPSDLFADLIEAEAASLKDSPETSKKPFLKYLKKKIKSKITQELEMLKEKNEMSENEFLEGEKNSNSNSIDENENIIEDSVALKKKEDEISFEIKNITIVNENDNEIKDLNLIKSIQNLNDAFEKKEKK